MSIVGWTAASVPPALVKGLNMRGFPSPLEYGASVDVPRNVTEFRQLCETSELVSTYSLIRPD